MMEKQANPPEADSSGIQNIYSNSQQKRMLSERRSFVKEKGCVGTQIQFTRYKYRNSVQRLDSRGGIAGGGLKHRWREDYLLCKGYMAA